MAFFSILLLVSGFYNLEMLNMQTVTLSTLLTTCPLLQDFTLEGFFGDKDVVLENISYLVKLFLKVENHHLSFTTEEYADMVWDFMRPLCNVISMELSMGTAKVPTRYFILFYLLFIYLSLILHHLYVL